MMKEPQSIPGYRLLRLLGSGGMAAVYLAHQDSVDREVALKLMSRHLLTDPRFAERFLREARIAAKLQHRHIVSIFDVGLADEQPFIAMEYLSGGQVMPRDGEALSVDAALRCIGEIALALDYAHGKGFIHRDVKPDNILLREDGSSVLGDFGIARTVDSATMMTKTGAIVGTPFYMSPEQLRGKEVDGRADLYSLGVVFYQLLTGKVPYTASDSLAIGIMHMTAPVPRLPAHLSHLQPLLERMLQKEAADRVQSGRELHGLIAKVQQQQARMDVQALERTAPQAAIVASSTDASAANAPPRTKRIEPVLGPTSGAENLADDDRIEPSFGIKPEIAKPKREIPNVKRLPPKSAKDPVPDGNGRLEPSIGKMKADVRMEPEFGRMDPAMANAAWRRPEAKREAGSKMPWVLLVLLGLAGFGFYKKDWIEAQWLAYKQNSQSNPIATQAADAEAIKRYFDDTDADALSLYEKLLQESPADAKAKLGVERVVSVLLDEAQALSQNNPTRAMAILQRLARTQNDPRIGTLIARIDPTAAANGQNQQSTQAQSTPTQQSPSVPAADVDELLERALSAERAGQWLGSRGALALYLQALQNDPNNRRAREGVKQAEQAASKLLDDAIKRDELAAIERINKEWESAQRDSQLRQLRMRQWRAAQTDAEEQKASIAEWLNQAESALAAGQLTSPAGSSAADRFAAVLALEPNNKRAQTGMQNLVAALLSQAERAISTEQLDMAARLIEQARERGASARALASVEEKMERARAAETSDIVPVVVQNSAEDQAKREELMQRVDQAIANNQLIDPPGDSAIDLIRQAQRIGPSPALTQRIENLRDALKTSVGILIESGDFESGANSLASLRALGPDPEANGLRAQLLAALVGDIESKINNKELDAAERRIALLKQLDARHPQLDTLRLAWVNAGSSP